MSMETEPGPTDNLHLEAANAMMGLLNGSWAARLVHAAAELGIADHLVGEARDAAFLAAATQAHAPSLARLLRALTAIGVLNETDDRRYSLTQLGTTLRSDVPGSMRAWALLFFSDDQGKAWEALPHAIRTGEHAFRYIFGADQWTRLAARPDAARVFDQAMQSMTQGVNGALITH
jgi:orsellinic acid C2-O-methyltransferase